MFAAQTGECRKALLIKRLSTPKVAPEQNNSLGRETAVSYPAEMVRTGVPRGRTSLVAIGVVYGKVYERVYSMKFTAKLRCSLKMLPSGFSPS